jgi:hypothetical protein
MLRITIFISVMLIVNCGGSSTLTKSTEKKELTVASLVQNKIPQRIMGFDYKKQANIYFRKDVSNTKRDRVIKKIIAGDRYSEDKSKYKQIPEIIEKKEPFWPEYFPEKEISGQVQVDFRVASDGKPDIICIRNGISSEVDLIVAKYVSEYQFKPAVGGRSGKNVAYWMSIMNQY